MHEDVGGAILQTLFSKQLSSTEKADHKVI
jgi:hypothetical protein